MGESKRSILVGMVTALCIAAISTAAKSYVDVERIKTKMEYFVATISEIKQDVKEIKRYLIDNR